MKDIGKIIIGQGTYRHKNGEIYVGEFKMIKVIKVKIHGQMAKSIWIV